MYTVHFLGSTQHHNLPWIHRRTSESLSQVVEPGKEDSKLLGLPTMCFKTPGGVLGCPWK